jgi:hypothetical protein
MSDGVLFPLKYLGLATLWDVVAMRLFGPPAIPERVVLSTMQSDA